MTTIQIKNISTYLLVLLILSNFVCMLHSASVGGHSIFLQYTKRRQRNGNTRSGDMPLKDKRRLLSSTAKNTLKEIYKMVRC